MKRQCESKREAQSLLGIAGGGETEERGGRVFAVFGPPTLQEAALGIVWQLHALTKKVKTYARAREATC